MEDSELQSWRIFRNEHEVRDSLKPWYCSGWYGSVAWASSCALNVCWFDSQAEHMPRLMFLSFPLKISYKVHIYIKTLTPTGLCGIIFDMCLYSIVFKAFNCTSSTKICAMMHSIYQHIILKRQMCRKLMTEHRNCWWCNLYDFHRIILGLDIFLNFQVCGPRKICIE